MPQHIKRGPQRGNGIGIRQRQVDGKRGVFLSQGLAAFRGARLAAQQMAEIREYAAQAEAMRELSMKNATTAYQLREGISATPKNGTPAYLYQELLAEFERRLMR